MASAKPHKGRKGRSDRRLTMAQAREIRTAMWSGPAVVQWLNMRDGVRESNVMIWKIRHHRCYRELQE